MRVPDGEITVNGKKVAIKNLNVSTTEIPWEVYDVFAYRLDLKPDAPYDKYLRPSKPYGAPDKGFGHTGFPAIGISLAAAERFTWWLKEKTGRNYRLPTEAEWEYFARAGQASPPADLEAIAWLWENSDDKTQPVGKKPANAWGLHDVFGNAAEWVTAGERDRIVAGGSWRDKKATVNFGFRARQTPDWNRSDPQNPKSRWWLADASHVGFRVVWTP